MPRLFTDEEISQAMSLRAAGDSYETVAAQMNCCINTLRKNLARRGLELPRSPYRIDGDVATSMYAEGGTIQSVANRLGVTRSVVTRQLKNRKILVRGRRRAIIATTLSEPERAYLAAIIDGEGSIVIPRYKNRYWLVVTVGNTDVRLMHWLTSHVGGTYRQTSRAAKGHRDMFVWMHNATPAVEILNLALPYMVLKRDQAECALEFQKVLSSRMRAKGRPLLEAFRNRLATLKGTMNHPLRHD